MRHISVEPPPFFRRGPSPVARLAFFSLLSVALLFTDTRFGYLESIRRMVAIGLYPLQRTVQMPGEALSYVGSYFASQRALANDNAELKRQLLSQAAVTQGYAAIAHENTRLLRLLDIESRFSASAVAAEVLYTSRDPFAQKVFIDKGEIDGVEAGQAVIDEQGVMGQVTRTLPRMAEVTLLTDKDHAVPVKIERSGVRSVLYGAGAGRTPELRFVAPSADIQTGDLLITSGIDGTYPPGLAVAMVMSVERETGQIFARISCRPMAGVDRSQYVLVLASATALPSRPATPADADAPRKAGKGKRRSG